MSPAAKRSLITTSVLMIWGVLLLSALPLLGRNPIALWLGVTFLLAVGIWMFRHRKRFRTTFLVPFVSVPFLIGSHLSHERGLDSGAALAAYLVGLMAFIGALLVDAFWSPHKDDLAELEYLAAEEKESD